MRQRERLAVRGYRVMEVVAGRAIFRHLNRHKTAPIGGAHMTVPARESSAITRSLDGLVYHRGIIQMLPMGESNAGVFIGNTRKSRAHRAAGEEY